jgi:hypothetical protein
MQLRHSAGERTSIQITFLSTSRVAWLLVGFVAVARAGEVCEDNCDRENSQLGMAMLQHQSTRSAMTTLAKEVSDAKLADRPMEELADIKAQFLSTLTDARKVHARDPALATGEKCFDASAWLLGFAKEPIWKKYSQGDQDAVLASLFSDENIGTTNKKIVEFGFPDHDFKTSYGNGRNLIEANGFEPQLLMDGAYENLRVNLHKRFVTAENVVGLFDEFMVPLEADYVSVDIDSCDIWVAHAILEKYRPRVMSVEYNSNHALGNYTALHCANPRALGAYHWTGDNIYGASLSAIALAAQHRKYSVVYVTERLDVFLMPDELLCPGTAAPLETFKAATSLPLHGDYNGQFGPAEKLLTNFSDWLESHEKAL